MSTHKTIFWHDYETWGSNARKSKPCQFAGLRTDEDLNIIDDPIELYCRPSPEFLPHPDACVVTGIRPQEALEKGVNEAEFCARIAEQFMQPNTCVSGYNSIRFDDEVTRHLLYRCFYDPYEREWKNGNSRWDIIDLLRMTFALRPEGINWPKKEDGSPSFKLEKLTAANDIEHSGAHDALADVTATIEMAKLVKTHQPKLYDWVYQLRSKHKVLPLLDLNTREMLLHISGMYSSSRGCLAVVMPLIMHPVNNNGVIVYDLSQDPDSWLDLGVDAIRHRLFTRSADLEEGLERVALKTVHINKCPALAPMSVLNEESVNRFAIDLDLCTEHREKLLKAEKLFAKLSEVFAEPELEPTTDPDQMLYSGGFFNDQDRNMMNEVRLANSESLSALDFPFQDKRLPEMLFRYRARNFPDSLNKEEAARWIVWCGEQLKNNTNGMGLPASEYFSRLDVLTIEKPELQTLFDSLRDYGESLCEQFGVEA